jgi:hypothetical protein
MQHLGFSIMIEDIKKNLTWSMTDRVIPGTFKARRESVSFAVYMDSIEAGQYGSDPAAYRVIVWRLGQPRYYRLTNPKVHNDRVLFQATQLQGTMNDRPYTQLWSKTGVDGWRMVPETEFIGSVPSSFSTDMTGRLYAALRNNRNYFNTYGLIWTYEPDPRSVNGIVGVTFKLSYRMEPNANLIIGRVTSLSPYTVETIDTFFMGGGGTPLPGSTPTDRDVTVLFSAKPTQRFVFQFMPNVNGTTYNPGSANPEGTWFIEISNIRLVSNVSLSASTTLTVAATAGTNVLITVGSTANMIVGQEIVIGVMNFFMSDRTTIKEIVSATQFRADLAFSHPIGDYARTIRITERQIITDMITQIGVQSGTPYWLEEGAAMVQNSGRDIIKADWVDVPPIEVIKELASDIFYTYGVNPQGTVYFYPQGQNARRWIVDADTLEIGRPIDGSTHQLYNRIYARYTDSNGRVQITAPADDLAAQARDQIVRSHTIDVETTSLAIAEQARNIALLDMAARPIESAITSSYILTPHGSIVPADSVDEDDTITIRNISAAFSDPALTDIPVYEVEIDAENGQPTIVPKAPIPRLDRFLARTK